jgi:predicted N-acetyltransferase YhbS
VNPEPSGRERVEVRRLAEADIAAIIACVRRCYGETYGESGFYDGGWLIAQMRSGRLLSIGACDGRRVVGHIGTTVTSPGDPVGDTVAAMVDPAYRGEGLLRRMGRLLFATFRERGIAATRHLATGTHLRTQRPLADSGAVPTGVLLGHVQTGTRFRGVKHRFGHQRIGVVAYFQRYGELEDLDVHLPTPYESVLIELYQRAGLARNPKPSITAAVAMRHDEPTTQVAAQHDQRAGVSTLRIATVRDDRMPVAELADALEHRAEVAYVDVPLTHPDCPPPRRMGPGQRIHLRRVATRNSQLRMHPNATCAHRPCRP